MLNKELPSLWDMRRQAESLLGYAESKDTGYEEGEGAGLDQRFMAIPTGKLLILVLKKL